MKLKDESNIMRFKFKFKFIKSNMAECDITIYMLDTRKRKVPYDFCKTSTTGDISLIHVHITPPFIYEYIKGGVANLSLLKISFELYLSFSSLDL